jgi:DNA polymerase III alpha subunit
MYVINGSLDDPNPPKKERRYHLVVLAKNAVGYRNLVKLTSISHLRGMRGRGIFARACIDKATLEQHSEGLIVATACLGGEIPQAILRGRPDVARTWPAGTRVCSATTSTWRSRTMAASKTASSTPDRQDRCRAGY